MNSTSSQDKTKATIFIRRHLDECLKCEYLTVRDPRLLWKNLKERFDYQKEVVLPATLMNGMLCTFKTSRKSAIITLQCSE